MDDKPADNKTFADLMRSLKDYDDGIIILSNQEAGAVIGDISNKVDALADLNTRFKAEEDRVDGIIKEFQEKKKQIQNAHKRFKEYIVYSMEASQATKVPGELYSLSIQSRSYIKPQQIEISTDLYVTLNLQKDGVVKREYSFDSKAFAALCDENPEVLAQYGETTVSTFPMFRAKKGIQ
jgi:hypothetical protein